MKIYFNFFLLLQILYILLAHKAKLLIAYEGAINAEEDSIDVEEASFDVEGGFCLC